MSLRHAIVIVILCAPALAAADGAVLRRGELGDAAAALQVRVQEARAADPQAFALVRSVDAYRPEGYRRFRSQRPTSVGLIYRRLGARALWPLVELAALDAPALHGLSAAELSALRVGLLDAIGLQRRVELAPLLRAAMLRSSDLDVAGTAAIGLGQLGDRELEVLLEHAHGGDRLLVSAIRGLGASRRPRAVERLAQLLDRTEDPALARVVVDALGEAGSAWAWQTGRVGTLDEGGLVRQTCADALARRVARAEQALALSLGRAQKRVTPIAR